MPVILILLSFAIYIHFILTFEDDFFTFYTNKSVEKNIEMFDKDMEFISKAIESLPDRKR
jgi:hypothetical protein